MKKTTLSICIIVLLAGCNWFEDKKPAEEVEFLPSAEVPVKLESLQLQQKPAITDYEILQRDDVAATDALGKQVQLSAPQKATLLQVARTLNQAILNKEPKAFAPYLVDYYCVDEGITAKELMQDVQNKDGLTYALLFEPAWKVKFMTRNNIGYQIHYPDGGVDSGIAKIEPKGFAEVLYSDDKLSLPVILKNRYQLIEQGPIKVQRPKLVGFTAEVYYKQASSSWYSTYFTLLYSLQTKQWGLTGTGWHCKS